MSCLFLDKSLLFHVSLLVGLDFLESEEVFSLKFFEFSVDVADVGLNPWDYDLSNPHVLQRIHSAISDSDDLVKSDEGGLQAGELDQDLHQRGEALAAVGDGSSAA